MKLKNNDFPQNKRLLDIFSTNNHRRPHLSNDMLTSIQIHMQNKLKRKQYKSKKLSNDVIAQL